jgi:uncharacterized protein (DUF1697 family)
VPAFVALLRGINVGKAKRIAMADLKALLSALGHQQVTTLLNSGNAVFRAAQGTSAQHASGIARAISEQFGLDVPVVVKSQVEFDRVVADNTLVSSAPDLSRLLAVFSQDPAVLARLGPVAALIEPPEQFLVGSHAAYLHCANGILASKAGEALLGKAGTAITTRNWATVLKLQALLHERLA